MKLIIVESPTKAKTLSKFLGKDYRIEATMGHIRDLPKAELGVDVDHGFTPSYVIPRAKAKHVGELKEVASKADSIILATDPDREGEAIAFHIAYILSTSTKKSKSKAKSTRSASDTQTAPDAKPSSVSSGQLGDMSKFSRIVFHEITEDAIKAAIAHPRQIDMQLVDAQQARRVLDRLVGYKLSPLLWKKLSKRWLSAGRVQSVAVRLIVEREREITAFISAEYWTIDGTFRTDGESLVATLMSYNGQAYETSTTHHLFDGDYTVTGSRITSQQAANEIIRDIKAPFMVSALDTKEIKRFPSPPFITSTLQQEAGRRFYFSSKKTMQLAQKLYEEGFITYHRTDSVSLSSKFVEQARSYIQSTYGERYVPSSPRLYKTKSKVAQEAHEAIRPTDISRQLDPQSENSFLNRDHARLYDLIRKRALASQAAEAIFDSTTVEITSTNAYIFALSGSVVKFDGFLAIWGRDSTDILIPTLTVGQTVELSQMIPVTHTTAPPPRYTESSLVKTLEEKDIGRPSTYAPIISTIQDRQYITKQEKKLVPTDLGFAVTDFLVQYFSTIMDLPFTADMENKFDAIANGQSQWVPMISEFYAPFAQILEKTYEEAQKVKVAEEALEEKCPDCGAGLVLRMGRYGKFVACSTFPACKYTRQHAEKIDKKCPKCGSDIVVKRSRRGKMFYGCGSYPKCTFAAWKKEDIK